jgi:hypothetical protein
MSITGTSGRANDGTNNTMGVFNGKEEYMGVKMRHVEQLVQVAVAKPLTWALYVCGVILVILAVASLRSAKWLTQKWMGRANILS